MAILQQTLLENTKQTNNLQENGQTMHKNILMIEKSGANLIYD